MADVDWITGHTYIVYGHLANDVSATVFEYTPTYPLSLLGNSHETQIDSILFCSHCHALTWRGTC
ncbi:hypothetical protein BYT27DRAFT_7197459 [Phlegmacium glaucopus]|nr:hypothetical protein BYT27DRAFT_7197459 [Phlegmacium glaucopus]